jgi:HSP20 family protein
MSTEQKQDNGGNPTKGAEAQRGMTRAGSEGARMARREPLDPLAAAFEGPFTLMSRLIQDMDRMFYGMSPTTPRSPLQSREWRPAVDVMEQDGKLVVHADLPGLQKENLNVEVRDDQLIISGERRNESARNEGDYRLTERSYGRFARSVPLPEGVNPDEVAAKFQDGVLRIEVPLPQGTQRGRRQIPIG